MKYLLIWTLAFLSLSSLPMALAQVDENSELYHGISYNQDVTRKFNLAQTGAIEVETDIRYRPNS